MEPGLAAPAPARLQPPARRTPTEIRPAWTPGPGGPGPAPLYRRAGVLVTHEVLIVGDRRYGIAGLSRLRVGRCSRNPVTPWGAVLAGAVFAAVGVGVSLGLRSGEPGSLTYAVLAVAMAVPVLVALYAGHRARRTHELWGEHHGRTVLLFASTEEREFGQVTRALMRAREANLP